MEVVLRVTPHLIQGIYLTLYLSIAGMVLSLLVGFIGGMIRSARVPLLSALWEYMWPLSAALHSCS